MVKDATELELLATACRITAQAFADVLPRIRPDLSERALAGELDHRMAELGAERPAFDTIVASGPNGAIPHHAPTGRPLRRGDLITMDFGALLRRLSRGHDPYRRARRASRLAARDLRAGRGGPAGGLRGGAAGGGLRDVDAAARDLISAAGHGEHFQHGLGHGVGLEVHEAPLIGYGSTGKLEDRVPVTVEPGVYLPGRGGVRIEDVLIVGPAADRGQKAGQKAPTAQILTTTTRELLAL